MPEDKRNEGKPEATQPLDAREDALNEEEKLLERRPDVNMPAILTKDVPGG